MITIIKENLITNRYCEIIDGEPRYCILGTVFHALGVPDDILINGNGGVIAAALPAGEREKFFKIGMMSGSLFLQRSAQSVADYNDSGDFEEAYYKLREMGIECEFVEKGKP